MNPKLPEEGTFRQEDWTMDALAVFAAQPMSPLSSETFANLKEDE